MQKIVAKPGRGAGARPAPRGKRTAPKSEEVFVGIDLGVLDFDERLKWFIKIHTMAISGGGFFPTGSLT